MVNGSPQRVLVVEDELAIVELISEMLEDLSFKVAAVASDLDKAVTLAQEIDIDLAILDVRLQGQQSVAVARILQSRDIPFIFATGYRTSDIDQEFQAIPALPKPFRTADLARAIRSVQKRSPDPA
jgi:CheY-like chemotaxis protein